MYTLKLLSIVPPELHGPSGHVYVMEHSPMAELFQYRELLGLPPPHSYHWLRDGKPFEGNPRVSLVNGNKTLSIRDASREDAGNYTLTVLSASGQDSLSLDLNITCENEIYSGTPKCGHFKIREVPPISGVNFYCVGTKKGAL